MATERIGGESPSTRPQPSVARGHGERRRVGCRAARLRDEYQKLLVAAGKRTRGGNEDAWAQRMGAIAQRLHLGAPAAIAFALTAKTRG